MFGSHHQPAPPPSISRAHIVRSRPGPRPARAVGEILTFAVGVLIAVAVLTMLLASLRHPLDCIDPQRCPPFNEAVHLERWTQALRPPVELQAEAFRGLARIGTVLTLLVLGVVGVNLGTRLGSTALARMKLYAVRAVLGATPRDLLRPLAREAAGTILMAVFIGTLGGAVTAWLLRRSWPLGPAPWAPSSGSASLLVLAAITLLAALVVVITLFPASVGWRHDLRRYLVTGGRATSSPTEGLVREGLVVLQVACTLVLVVAAALLLTAIHPEGEAHAGPEGSKGGLLASAELHFAAGAASLAPSHAVSAVLERVRGVPGVTDTSVATEGAPLGIGVEDRVTALCAECGIGSLPKQQTSATARIHGATPGLFRMLGLEVLRGRDLSDADAEGAARVAVVSRAFVVRFFPGGDPLGKEVRLGELPGLWFTVVGVVDDLPARGLGSAARWEPVLYLSMVQLPPASSRIMVRVDPRRDPADVLRATTSSIEGLLRGAELGEWTPLQRLIERERAPLRWFGVLFGLLAAAVTVLATIGLHDLMTHTVATRGREIGVRMAIGADEAAIVRMTIRRSCRLVAIGLVVGSIPLGGIARLLQLRFEGVDPWNPLLALAVAGLLLSIAVLASRRAAHEATRLDPAAAMRG